MAALLPNAIRTNICTDPSTMLFIKQKKTSINIASDVDLDVIIPNGDLIAVRGLPEAALSRCVHGQGLGMIAAYNISNYP